MHLRQRRASTLKVRLIGVLVATSVLIPSAAQVARAGFAVNDVLPDLRMEPLYGLYIQETARHKLHLRFGTLVDNIGDGPIIVRGNKRVGENLTHVVQRIWRSDGSFRDRVQPDASIYYEAQRPHVHWHLADFISMRLAPLAQIDPPAERRARKIGFCLADGQQMPEDQRPPNSVGQTYFDCGTEQSTRVRMGISVGWGDVYQPYYSYQWVDVTGLPAGDYRLCAFVNPQNLWLEKATGNNYQYVDVSFDPQAKSVTVNSTGTSPC